MTDANFVRKMRFRTAIGCALFSAGCTFVTTQNIYDEFSEPVTPQKIRCSELAGDRAPKHRYVEMTHFAFSDAQVIKGNVAWVVVHPENNPSTRAIVVRTSSNDGMLASLRSQSTITGVVRFRLTESDREALRKFSPTRSLVLVQGDRWSETGNIMLWMAGNLLLLAIGIGAGVGAVIMFRKALTPTTLEQLEQAPRPSTGYIRPPTTFETGPATPPGPLASEEADDRTSESRTVTSIIQCANCGMRVIPKADKTCPSCQHPVKVP